MRRRGKTRNHRSHGDTPWKAQTEALNTKPLRHHKYGVSECVSEGL
jgi:hypothetical protein